ncbi:MAG: TrkH family potassium uptake protein [Candidatus Margulisbacteria bacterium]|nr:TrkH family potassium uptake protein [Candidatus Margulisiibacteriota bacterium]
MIKIRPSTLIAFSFLVLITIGAVLLSLPVSSAKGIATNFLDSYFTANSAVCVTGLVTLDTGTHFSLFGLIIIMCLMQVGGLGYMTFSTFLVLVFRRKMFVSEKLMIMEALNIYSLNDVLQVLRKIFGIVFLVEGVGALILFLRFLPEMGAGRALLYGVFHAISAFNNAGFALPANFANLAPYVTDVVVNLTVTTLIIIGGIGFLVIADILQFKRWSLHTKLVVVTTLLLIIGGTLVYLILEYNNTLAPLALQGKVLASYFQAVTPRTAGFNTLDMGKLLPVSALFIMILMFIGASPGGTGGGIKTTTFALIASTIWATLRNSRDTVLFNRRVPAETVRRAFAIMILGLLAVALPIFLLSGTEKFNLTQIAFETFSAFGTVGLSMGITPFLSSAGKIIIIVTMFIGRVGPLTLLLALAIGQRESKIEPPKEGVSIG